MARKSFAYAIYAFKYGQLQSPYIETSRKHRSIEYGLSHTRCHKRFAWIDAYMIDNRYIMNIWWIYIVPFLLETDHTFQISRTRTVNNSKVTTKTILFHRTMWPSPKRLISTGPEKKQTSHMQQAKATKTLVFQFDHVNPRVHVSIGLGPPPRTPVAHKGTGWDSLRKNKNLAGDCYPRINNYIISICFKFWNPRCYTTKIGRDFCW